MKIKSTTYFFSIIWLAIVLFGVTQLLKYGSKAGQSANISLNWPGESHLVRTPDSWTLVIFMHPMCPCSYASLAELDKIMNKTHGHLNAFVVFFRPGKFPAAWQKSNLMNNARAIPGINIITDENGQEAKLFGSLTSGQSLLYNPAGQIVFSGGITRARGHQGDNAGEDSIVRWVNNKNGNISHTSVFGCDLFKKTSEMASNIGRNIQ